MKPTPRILHVVATLGYGGVAQMLWRHYRRLDRTRCQFDFITHGQTEDFHAEIQDLGGRVYHLDTPGRLGLRRYVQSLRHIIHDHGPYTAIHAHTNYQCGIVGLAAWLEGVATRIAHIRGVLVDDRNRRRLPLYRALIRLSCNTWLACSREAGLHYYGRRPFRIIPNAVDLDAFEADTTSAVTMRAALGIADDAMILGHVGRFSPEKNHAFLLILLQHIRSKGVSACLILVGDGPLMPSIAEQVAALGLESHVRILGVRRDIPAILRAMDVLLLPSFSEGMPNVVIEAQAAGLPTLITDTITRDVDLGVGLVHPCPLQFPSRWIDTMLAIRDRPRPDRVCIRHAIHQAGFDLNGSVENLLAIYGLVNATVPTPSVHSTQR